ncbi:hypothetical protein HYALB_00003141 [Hymenoscyphus albidus]|uniref:Uncharacterized protein n=1 Tax=Hymenoscyphus albidus TaxID=595503 RepID=A0A9N9LDC8_9HELO|nr:hypothetical protein HYALB_00003141 [Hymenoscyphus albidus]
MAAALKSALPSHLKPSNLGDALEFQRKHHGKTQSHMGSSARRGSTIRDGPSNPAHSQPQAGQHLRLVN